MIIAEWWVCLKGISGFTKPSNFPQLTISGFNMQLELITVALFPWGRVVAAIMLQSKRMTKVRKVKSEKKRKAVGGRP